ncbi:MAG: hypothetical protein ABUL60_25465 [Myxococcales bacterium]
MTLFFVPRAGCGRLCASLLLSALAGCGSEQAADHVTPPGSTSGSGAGGAANAAAGSNPGGSSATAGSTQTGSGGGGVGGASAGAAGMSNAVSGAAGVAGAAVGGAAGTGSSCPNTSAALAPWPGKNDVKTLDLEPQFKSDLSGLTYEPAAAGATGALWAVNNLSGTLFRLVQSGSGYAPDSTNGWAAGKVLHYPTGKGQPDSEGVTFGASVADGVYVGTEHDGDDASTSRPSVLRYDVSGAGTSLTATREWNLTALLPKLGANTGIEGITWVPDSYLTTQGFLDESKARAYAPAEYANHGTGLFFVGIEESGKLYGFALNHADGSAALLATISAPTKGVMGLEFDRDTGDLWFNCDDGCDNQSGILRVDTRADSASRGKFVLYRLFQRPSSLPNSNNEGIALAPNSECSGGFKRFFWTDDADQDGFSLRSDLIPCNTCF